MKKRWEDPRIMLEQFVPNEYVAACYKIKCTTPNGNSTYYELYDDTNGNGELDNGDKKIYSNGNGFWGCNNWHKGVIRDSAPTANGFVVREIRTPWSPVQKEVKSVFWWSEKLGSSSDYHVMVPGAENYETNPNAS